MGLEGVVSKRASSPTSSGRGDPLAQDEVHAAAGVHHRGLRRPRPTSKRAVGSLVLGAYENGRLVYVGRVGTGFTAALAQSLWRRVAAAAPLHAALLRQAPTRRGRPGRNGSSPRSSAKSSSAAGPAIVCCGTPPSRASGRIGPPRRSSSSRRTERPRSRGLRRSANRVAHASRPRVVAGRGPDQAGPGCILRRRSPTGSCPTLSIGRSRSFAARSARGEKCFFAKHPWDGLDRHRWCSSTSARTSRCSPSAT